MPGLMLGGGDTVVAKTDSAPPSRWGSESSGKDEQLARHLEEEVSTAHTGDAQAGRRLEEVNRADLGSLPGGGVKVINLFIRLLGAGGRYSRQREQHMQMPRGGEGREEMSFQGHWRAIESFRAEVLSWGWVPHPPAQGRLDDVWGCFWLSPLRDAPGIEWVRARDASGTVPRTAPTRE